MKLSNLLLYGGMTMAVGTLVGGCAEDLFLHESPGEGDGLRMEFSATIDQSAETRADESGFADGDRFGVFVVNYSGGQPGELTLQSNQVNNMAMTFDAESNEWKPASDIYWMDNSTPADVYGYYPYDNGMGDVQNYRFEVASDQSKPAEDGEMCSYEASDLLWAKAATVAPGKRVSLSFGHAMGGVKVVLRKGSGFEGDTWQKLSRVVTIDNTVRVSSVDLRTGAVTPDGSVDRSIVMCPNGSDTYRGIVVPQNVPEGKPVISVTIDGVAYSLRRQDITRYTAGKLHNFTITVDRKAGEGTYALTLTSESITDWEADTQSHAFDANSYLVVNVPEAGRLKESLQAINCDIATLRNLKVKGLLTESDFSMMRGEMRSLASINLKDVRIVGITDREYENGKWSDGEKVINDMLPRSAFREFSSLRRVVLPDGLKRIGAGSCEQLKLTSTLIIPESVTVIEEWAFASFGEDGAIIMPSSLEWIGDGAFNDVRANTEIRLGNRLKHIGNGAFDRARGMTGTFSLPQGLDYLGDHAFADCGHDLTGDIEIPVGMKEVPDHVFRSMGFSNGTNLILPEGLKKIGGASFAYMRFKSPVKIPESVDIIGEAAFVECHFTEGRIVLPKEVKYIGRQAIAWTNVSGTLEYPKNIDVVLGRDDGGQFGGNCFEKIILGDNVLQIQTRGFDDSKELKYLEIGKNVNYIGDMAFAGCPQLSTIVCLASDPPKLQGSVFTDVYFDKCVLEVPEKSVDAYRNASGWNQFRNITAHKDLAVNISDIVCLDKGAEREGIVRAESAWSVTECPSWVHVSPSKGTYKDDITVKVDAMSAGSATREGRIVFSLDGKSYTTYTTVRQLAYEYGEDKEITLQTASAGGNEIPVFIVGEGFDAEDITGGKYMEKMRETMEYLFAIEPFKSYRNLFTVSTAIACSAESGTGDLYTVRQNCFNSNGVVPNTAVLRQYVQRVSAHAGRNMGNALIIMVSNYNSFDGWSSIEDDKCSIASVGIVDGDYPYDQRGLVQHFAGGEAFAGLGNEAVSHFEHIKGCSCSNCNALGNYVRMKNRGYYANLTMSSKMGDAPWRDFIFHPKYSQTVDMWEGGYNHYRGVWRSESQSVMGTYIAYYNAISRYTIYKEIMRRSGLAASMSDFMEKDKTEQRQ